MAEKETPWRGESAAAKPLGRAINKHHRCWPEYICKKPFLDNLCHAEPLCINAFSMELNSMFDGHIMADE